MSAWAVPASAGQGRKKPAAGSRSTPSKRGKRRRGLPEEGSVVSTGTFTSPRTGHRYRVLRTTETDPYDKPAKPPKKDS